MILEDENNKNENGANLIDKPQEGLEKTNNSATYSENMMATAENKEEMKKRIEALGDFMKDSNFSWNIDGAFNISLYGNDFIRRHKDIDLSVKAEELDKLADFLEKKGFSIYASVPESNKLSKNGTPIDFEAFHEDDQVNWAEGAKRILVKYDGDKNGELYKLGRQNGFMACVQGDDGRANLKVNNQPLNGLDLHVYEINGEQREVNQRFYVAQNSVAPVAKEYNDRKIFLENPSLTLFHKSFSGRQYDGLDIKKFMELLNKDGKLSSTLEKTYDLLAKDKEVSMEQAVGIFEAIWEKIGDKTEYNDLENEILGSPIFVERMKDASKDDLEKIKHFAASAKEILLASQDLLPREEVKKMVIKLGFEIFQPTLRDDLARSSLENAQRELSK